MTHLSEFSYLSRLVNSVFILTWALLHAYSFDRWASLSWSRIRKLSLQSLVAVLLILSQVLWIVYDSIVARAKYTEGYTINADGRPGPAEIEDYSDYDRQLIDVADVILNFVFAAKNSALLLLLATFFRATRAPAAEHEAGNRSRRYPAEYVFYLVWSLISLGAYPLIQWLFREYAPPLYKTTGPQLLYNVELMAIIVVCQITVKRLARTMNGDDPSGKAHRRVQFYMRMLHWLSIFSILDVIGTFVVNIDTMTDEQRIYRNKFWTDMLTIVFTIGSGGAYIPAYLITFPPLSITNETVATLSTSNVDVHAANVGGARSPSSPAETAKESMNSGVNGTVYRADDGDYEDVFDAESDRGGGGSGYAYEMRDLPDVPV